MQQKIGIFGGTFDPPHLGHIILASEVLHQLHLNKVYWVLTPDSPFKTEQQKSAIEQRIEMVRITIADDPGFEISLMELERPGPHYTADTVSLFRQKYPNDQLTLLMGGDSLAQFHGWYKPEEILRTVDNIGVMLRPGEGLSIQQTLDQFPQINQKIQIVHAPLLQISSSDIRSRVHAGDHFRYYLPHQVYQYIITHKLYS